MNFQPTYKYNDWFSHIISNLEPVVEKFKGKPVDILEIGCFEGRSTSWFVEKFLGANKHACIESVDPWSGSTDLIEVNDWDEVASRWYKNVHGLADSLGIDKICIRHIREASRDYFDDNNGNFDIIYVDGSHEKSDVAFDLFNSWQRLTPGGVLIADDYGWNGPANWDPQNIPRVAIDFFKDCVERSGELAQFSTAYQAYFTKK